jgi:DNA-binding response OmpR family regulator/HPt (histidine-containing phosphotransfer) domain-containing protein
VRILVVEDDALIAETLRSTLDRHNYAIEIVNDGRVALNFIEAFSYDLVLLDVILPNLDGISLCQYLRSHGYLMPILLLTSQDSKHDRAIGLDAGADDYVTKPFDPEELSARIRALLRRGTDKTQPILTWEDLTLDPRNCEVTYQHQLLSLTPKEYALLELFLRDNRRLFSCGAILEHLWTYEDAPSEEAVRTHIKGLRHKLKSVGAPHNLVETVYGIGYRLKPFDPLPPQAPNLATTTVAVNFSNSVNDGIGNLDLGLLPSEVKGVSIGVESVEVDRSSPAVANHPPIDLMTKSVDPFQFLNEIWNRHYDETIDRVRRIERVITDLQERSIDNERRLQAWNAAHTLAGGLGTFGLTIGSQAAKQIERLLDDRSELTAAQIPELQGKVAELWREIESKNQVSGVEAIAIDRSISAQIAIVTRDLDLVTSLQELAVGKFEIVEQSELTPIRFDRTPTSIVLDLDCFPLTREGSIALSELERDFPGVPVLVLSQNPESLDRDPILSQRIEVARRGGRMFLAKPISAARILLEIDRVRQQSQVDRSSILIVDDDRLLLDGIVAILSPSGMNITTLSEPSRFWETLETCVPDLLILDLDMPEYNGIELCRAVRTDPQWANLPIMFLTAHTAELAIDRVFAAGADDFIPKPAAAAALVTRIINRLERIGLRRSI